MATLSGISALELGDGAGGTAALSIIQNKVLRILSDDRFTWRFATYRNPDTAYAGTVSYYVPELLSIGSYSNSKYGKSGPAQIPQTGLVKVNIDTQKYAKYDLETFDLSRLMESDYIIGMIASALALEIQAELNAQFWLKLRNWFADTANQSKQIELEFIGSNLPYDDALPSKIYGELVNLNRKYIDIGQTFNKNAIGVNKAELFSIVSPKAAGDMPLAFRDQASRVGEWQVDNQVIGKQIFNIKFMEDNMLDTLIAKEQSFNGDYAVNLTNVLGLIAHNEAIAMPMNIQETVFVRNQDTGNPRVILKYQFGWGILRPWLLYLLVRKNNLITNTVPTENDI